MYRIIIAVTFVFAMLVGVIGGSPPRSLAAQASPTPEPTEPAELCLEDQVENWENEIDVQPFEYHEANVQPLDSAGQDLYLVVWTINPGACIPYMARGNQKDGAIVLIVQEGVVEFTAERFDVGSAAEVTWGHPDGEGTVLPFGTTQILNPGDWVTQNDQVWFTFRNTGNESAVILKAVLVPDIGDVRCSGGCK